MALFSDMIKKIQDKVLLKAFILFGSQARGEATDESDVDVLVVTSRLDKRSLDLILDAAWEVGFDAGTVISAIPATFDEMTTLSASPFFKTVKREGIRV